MKNLKNGFTTRKTTEGINVYSPDGKLFAKNVHNVTEYMVEGYWAILYPRPTGAPETCFGHKESQPLGCLYFNQNKIGDFTKITQYPEFSCIEILQPNFMDFGETKFLFGKNGRRMFSEPFTIFANGFTAQTNFAARKQAVFDREGNPFIVADISIRFSAKDFFAIKNNGRWELYSPQKQLLAKDLQNVNFMPDSRIHISEKHGHNLEKINIYAPDFKYERTVTC